MLWPVLTVVLFRKLPPDRALIITMLAGYLFLPEPPAMFDFPAMPPLSKHNIPALTAFLCVLWMYDRRGPLLPESKLGKGLILVFVLSPIFTALTNMEPVFFGEVGLPGLGPRDALALSIQQFLVITPFLMARQFLASGGALRHLMVAILIGGLAYSLLMLIEVRLSPQLNLWVYGYYQHFFNQSFRFGGWRPVVFLYHGLWVAFFLMTAVVSAWALWRYDRQIGQFKLFLFAAYLTLVLVLAKSLGALIFAALLLPLVVFVGTKVQIKVALVLALLSVGYPILKGADLIPEDRLIAKAESIDPDRAGSLQFRFDNEQILMNRAYIKPVFGWGSWGRNHILDPFTGIILTVTDGRWIITIGTYGWVGFLAEFGLLTLPILLIWREAVSFRRGQISPFVAPLTLILAINILDMIPNATLTPLTWLLAGALTGYAEQLKRARALEGPRILMDWKPILRG